jgi:hypothetical protein
MQPRDLAIVLALFGAAGVAADDKPISDEDRRHWAFVRPKRPEVPTVHDSGRVAGPIDAFLTHRLESEGLRFSPEADRATLLRRLSFDLVGLPPTPAELDVFVADRSPCAYETQVDRLLASPQYGERWAQHWLDLARHADTDGFEFDDVRPDAWRYRDWVVHALNDDLPYDRFLALQMAGDELAPDDPDAAIPTGFHRAYPDMVDLNDQALRRQNALDDITETTGLVFLGLTIGCARCHDHKSDPIRQVDFYGLQAFFTPARFRDDFPLASAAERADHAANLDAWKSERATLRATIVRLEAPARERLAPGPPPGVNDRTAAAFARSESERSAEDNDLIFEAQGKDTRVSAQSIAAALEPDQACALADARDALERLKAPHLLPKARVLDEAGPEAPATFLRKRGDFYSPGPEIAPAFPAVLSSEPANIVTTSHSTGRRTALAAWLTRADHPLTARVIVNRLWQHHFGNGLVTTPSDFGRMGEAPSHPELLDWLATELVARGWSLKAMHRLMVTSAAYRQSSRHNEAAAAVDPGNALLWRQSRRRLDGEAIRDAVLAVSGRLNRRMGGPGVFPELPPELSKLSSRGAAWPVSADPVDRDRRSLYVFVRRNLRYPFFEAFDRPDPNASCPRRPVTTIAPQALSLLNGRLSAQAARDLAARIATEAGPDRSAQIDTAYRLTLGRPPDADERRLANDFVSDPGGSTLADLALVLFNLNEFVTID